MASKRRPKAQTIESQEHTEQADEAAATPAKAPQRRNLTLERMGIYDEQTG